MSACEKCWNDAYLRMMTRGGSQADHYHELLKERQDNPCQSDEQSGKYLETDQER